MSSESLISSMSSKAGDRTSPGRLCGHILRYVWKSSIVVHHFFVESPGMSAQEVHLPETTRSKLNEFQQQVRRIKVAEGIFAGLFGLMVSWAVVFGTDRLVDTSALVRAAILVAGALGFGVFLPLKCHRWVWKTRTMQQVARLLSNRYPALGDQLLGVIELTTGERDLGESHSLTTAAIEQVDTAVKDRNFTDAIPKPRSRQWAIAAAIPMLLLLIAITAVPDAAWNAVGRWLTPWRDIDRYTFAQIESLPADIVVPHGEEFQVSAMLKEETKWAPESGTILLDGQPNVAAAQVDGKFDFSLPSQTSDGALNVRIGDVRESVAVRPVTRPELTAMTASVTLPDYLEYTKQLTQDVRGGAISVVKGASVAFDAEVSRDLAEATVSAGEADITGSTIRTSGLEVADSSIYQFEWTDTLGLSSREPFPLNIRAVDDAAPQVSCIQNEPLQVILSTDVITFSVSAGDDFGLRLMGLEWSGVEHPLYNPNPDTADKVVQAGHPEERSLSTQATFCAESDNVRPQFLKMHAWAEDYMPDRGRVYSPAVMLHVLTPEDHAVWMSQQLRRWASRADDVYEQEMRLHDANRELRRMDADELRTRDNQRRIQQQASSERANAQRLSAVTGQGDQLIRQAMRNPEMLVGHLETFAQALKQLRGIAENKMPSVADMLAEAAQAKRTKQPPANSSSAEKAKSSPMAGNDRSTPKGSNKPGSEKKKKNVPTVPSLVDKEQGFNPANPEDEDQKPKDTPPESPKFGLPVTQLQGGPQGDKKKPKQDQKPDPKVDQAVEEQADLLAEFEKVRDDLQKIMDDLDNSTFVKRLKSASRRQLEMASDLNRTLFKGFGLSSIKLEDREREQTERIAVRQEQESQSVWLIKSDLEAYYSRRKEEKFRRIADEMAELEVVSKLVMLGPRVRSNLSGDSISRVEFWADTLDRWAEELVSASKCGACKGCKGDSLPPSIVLEIMRILEGEIDLRDETRAAETAKKAVKTEEYEESLAQLFETQTSIHDRTLAVMDDIRAIPNGENKFGKELKIIGMAAAAMHDAADLLSRPTTDSDVIAAETEAIEMLLQAKRCNPKGGGGGSSPGGGGGGDTETVALAMHGPGADPNAHIESRDIQQATGTTNDQLPAEFRDGLEDFFNAVEIGN
jgi:hypothetical protein